MNRKSLKMLNETERKARQWLLSQGYADKDLTFQPSNSPDFIANNGIGYEVKKIYNKNCIVFYEPQWEHLYEHGNTRILVFNGGDMPDAVIDFRELTKPPSQWHNYTLKMSKIDGKKVNIGVEVGLWQRAKAQAALEGKTVNNWAVEALEEKLEKTKEEVK